MECYIAFLFSLCLLPCVDGSFTEQDYCPKSVKHGHWEIDDLNGYRCILKCDSGFEPSDCHVIRRDKHGDWERNIPTCVEAPMVSRKTLVSVGFGAAAVVVAPYALAAAGFGAAGVAAGSLAAWIQGPATAAGSWFALGQSAGAAGIAASTQAGIFRTVSGVTKAASEYFSGCEAE